MPQTSLPEREPQYLREPGSQKPRVWPQAVGCFPRQSDPGVRRPPQDAPPFEEIHIVARSPKDSLQGYNWVKIYRKFVCGVQASQQKWGQGRDFGQERHLPGSWACSTIHFLARGAPVHCSWVIKVGQAEPMPGFPCP